jgi:hypothetical protein
MDNTNIDFRICQECSTICENIIFCDIDNDCEYLDIDDNYIWGEMSYYQFVEKSLEFKHSEL